MPVLVFRERTGSKVVLENVGNGPAMNIILPKGGRMTLQPTPSP